jgi:hypothetical protein
MKNREPKQNADDPPVEVDELQPDAWQRADDDHVRDMMRALVRAIEDSKKPPGSQPSSKLWES